MAKSIMQSAKESCYICGSHVWLEEHHIFGAANRKLSEKYGLKVWLCHGCHNTPPIGVHHNAVLNNHLKAEAQRKAMERYGWTVDKFRKVFGKNYL